MRYFEIPGPVIAERAGKPVPFSFDDMHNEMVWGDPYWRESLEAHEALFRCYDEIAGKKPGKVVALSDEDFEKYKPIATGKGKNIQGQAMALNQLMRPIFSADSKPPKQNLANADEKKDAPADVEN